MVAFQCRGWQACGPVRGDVSVRVQRPENVNVSVQRHSGKILLLGGESGFLFYLGLHLTGWGPPHLGGQSASFSLTILMLNSSKTPSQKYPE